MLSMKQAYIEAACCRKERTFCRDVLLLKFVFCLLDEEGEGPGQQGPQRSSNSSAASYR